MILLAAGIASGLLGASYLATDKKKQTGVVESFEQRDINLALDREIRNEWITVGVIAAIYFYTL